MAATSGAIRAGAAFVELFAKDDALRKGLARAQAHLKAWGASITAIGQQLLTVGGLGVAGFVGALKVFTETGSQLEDLSKRTGASVESLSALQYAADRTGVSSENLGQAIRHMQKYLMETGMYLGETLEQQLGHFSEQMGNLQDPALKSARAMEVFGKGGVAMLPFLALGSEGIAELTAHARDLGLVLGGEEVAAAKELSLALGDMWKIVKMTAFQIGAALAPEVMKLLGPLTMGASLVLDFVKANKGYVVVAAEVALGVTAAGAALYGLGLASTAAAAGVGFLSATLGTIGAIVGALTTPIGAVAALLAVGGGAWLYYSGTGSKALAYLGQQFGGLFTTVQETWGGIRDALAAGDLTMAARVAWAGVKAAVLSNTIGLQSAWVEFTTSVQMRWAEVVATVTKGWVTIKSYGTEAIAWLGEIWGKISTTAQQDWNDLVTFFEPIVKALGTLWEGFANFMASSIREAVKAVLVAMTPALALGAALGSKAASGVASVLSGALNQLAQAPGVSSFSKHMERARQNAGEARGDIQDDLLHKEDSLQAERDQRLKAIDDAAAAAQQELTQAREEAAEALRNVQNRLPENVATGLPDLGQVRTHIENATGASRGTFNAFAAGALGGGDKMTEVAKNTAKGNDLLKKIERNTKEGGLFAE